MSCPKCGKLDDDELEPTDEDLKYAKELIDQGWQSTSNRYRNVARFIEPIPDIRDMVSAEVLATYHGRRLADAWKRAWHSSDLRLGGEGVEQRTLTVKQFRAFKRLGGKVA